MKRAISSLFMAGSLMLASALPGLVYAQDALVPDAKNGEQLYVNGDMDRGLLACVTCHGEKGNSAVAMYPNIAAMPHEYLAKQLHDFVPKGDKPAARLGAEGNPSMMAPIAPALTEQDIVDISVYLSEQDLDWDSAPTASNEDSIERGQLIWRAGLVDKNVPACAACHSANGAGLPGEFPRLAGQHPEYILEQLKLFADGYRKNDIMHDIADRLNDKDMAAVADFAAGLR